MTQIRKLSDENVEQFDVEYIRERHWQDFCDLVDESYPSGNFQFLDIGGGNGMFSDRILRTYDKATCVLVDNSDYILAKNSPHERKRIVCADVSELSSIFQPESFDLVCFNWLLHHLVGQNYSESSRNVDQCLAATINLLKPGGNISVFENIIVGAVSDAVTSRLIFSTTSSAMLKPAAAFLGANTAGVGVCYKGAGMWRATLAKAGFQHIRYIAHEPLDYSLPKKLPFLLRSCIVGHFWASTTVAGSVF